MPAPQMKMSKDLGIRHADRDHFRTGYLASSIASPLHGPCRKDLRVSYLQQYEQIQNGKSVKSHSNKHFNPDYKLYNAEFDQSRTRDALKDITEKYGFDWDHKGKLIKKSQLQFSHGQYNTENKYRTSGLENRQNVLKQVNRSKQQLSCWDEGAKYKTQNYDNEKHGRKQTFEDIYHKWDGRSNLITSYDTKNIKQDKIVAQDKFAQTDLNRAISVPLKPKQLSFKNKNCSMDQQQIDDKINTIWEKYHRGEEIMSSSLATATQGRKLQAYENRKPVNSKDRHALRNSISLSDRQLPHFGNHDCSKPKIMQVQSFGCDVRGQRIRSANQTVENHRNPRVDRYKQEIEEITSKIKKCEQQKQKLQIAHKKFECHAQGSSKSTASRNMEVSQDCRFSKLGNEYKFERPSSCSPIRLTRQKQISKSPAKSTTGASLNKTREECKERCSVAGQSFHASSKSNQSEKPTLTDSKNTLTAKLCKQIELDSKFRRHRAWFNKNNDPHKWGILADCLLAKKDLKFNYHQLVEKFQNSPEEEDLFLPAETCQCSYNQLMSSFIAADTYWKAELSKKLTPQNCQVEHFTSKNLDRENKGKITMQSFIRYLNFRANTFHSKRDVIILFQRLAGQNSNEATFSQILRTLME